MMIRVGISLVTAWALIVGSTTLARAGGPTDELRQHVNRVLVALQDPALKGSEHRQAREAVVREAMDAAMDFTEVCRRALGPDWAVRTPAQQEQFVTVFSDFLKRAYLGRIDLYDDEKIVYDAETLDGDRATVTTRVQWKDGDEMPIRFRMIRGDGDRWRIYDVSMDGVSLVDSYRAQFSAVLRRGSYDDLVQRIKTLGPPAK
jgi:phospholipid transport system substrate-binding protein